MPDPDVLHGPPHLVTRRAPAFAARTATSPAHACNDADLSAAAADDREQRAAARERRAEATASNLGLGHDLRAGLADPSAEQLDGVRAIVCHLLARQHRDVIAYGADWTDRERQQPVGDGGRSEPRQADAIATAELERALVDPDPLRGIAQLLARWAAAFVLDHDGVTKTTALGSDRMSRRLDDTLPRRRPSAPHRRLGTHTADALPPLTARSADAFLPAQSIETTVALAAHRGESTLDDLDFADDDPATAAA